VDSNNILALLKYANTTFVPKSSLETNGKINSKNFFVSLLEGPKLILEV
jgi:hypothetical protein